MRVVHDRRKERQVLARRADKRRIDVIPVLLAKTLFGLAGGFPPKLFRVAQFHVALVNENVDRTGRDAPHKDGIIA